VVVKQAYEPEAQASEFPPRPSLAFRARIGPTPRGETIHSLALRARIGPTPRGETIHSLALRARIGPTPRGETTHSLALRARIGPTPRGETIHSLALRARIGPTPRGETIHSLALRARIERLPTWKCATPKRASNGSLWKALRMLPVCAVQAYRSASIAVVMGLFSRQRNIPELERDLSRGAHDIVEEEFCGHRLLDWGFSRCGRQTRARNENNFRLLWARAFD